MHVVADDRQNGRAWVFAYGSLVDTASRARTIGARSAVLERAGGGARPCELAGYRRAFAVAMVNRVDLPGYKHYVDGATGERPDVYVSFLDLLEDPSGAVNGLLVPVDAQALDRLDGRERSYERCEVTGKISPTPDGSVFAYIGTAAARALYRDGIRRESACVDAAYFSSVQRAFRSLGDGEVRRFAETTEELEIPVVPLRRIDATQREV